MFLGHYRHSLDAKGRVALPAPFRRELGGEAVIAPFAEKRLMIWPVDAWNKYVSGYAMGATTQAEQRTFLRFLYAHARPVELDAQGRLLLAADHRQFAQITERCVFAGVRDSMELVSEQLWDEENEKVTAELFSELGDRINRSNFTAANDAGKES